MAAQGANNEQVSRLLGVTDDTVRTWRRRWADRAEAVLAAEAEGDDPALEAIIAGVLADEPRPGTPATFTPEQWCQIMAVACEPPEASGRPIDRWTPRELAAEAIKRGVVARISATSVDRFLKGGRSAAPSESLLADAGSR